MSFIVIENGSVHSRFLGLSEKENCVFDNMGNAVPEISQGADFTERQRNLFRSLGRGKRFCQQDVGRNAADRGRKSASEYENRGHAPPIAKSGATTAMAIATSMIFIIFPPLV